MRNKINHKLLSSITAFVFTLSVGAGAQIIITNPGLVGGNGSNPFNQSLNTDDNVEFEKLNLRIADPEYIYATFLNTTFSTNPIDAMIMVDYGGGFVGFENYPTGQEGTYLYFDATDGYIDVNRLRADVIYGAPSGLIRIFPQRPLQTGGFLQGEVAIPAPNSDEQSQTSWLITAKRDLTNDYFDANFRFGATIGNGTQLPTYSYGSEGTLTSLGVFTTYRTYLYDQINNRSIWHIDNDASQTFIIDDTIDLLVSGGIFTVHGTEGANGLLQIASDQGDDATDTWGLNVNATGNSLIFINNAVTYATLTTAGLFSPVTIQPTTAYKSVDGTTGATVTTCTGFKNGLCISGT